MYSPKSRTFITRDHIQTMCEFISVIDQLDAQKFCFTVSLFHASTCFEHMRPSSGGQTCIIPPDDGHMCSKHVEA